MTSSKMLRSLFLLLVVLGAVAHADEPRYEMQGHSKFRLIGQHFPDSSLFRDLAGAVSTDLEGDLRLAFSADAGPWSFDVDYQLFALYGDSIEWTRDTNPAELLVGRLPNDDRRLMRLTDVIRDEGKGALLHRLDRLSVKYSSEKTVMRLGRQALSWGNGLFYSPMDLVNPFDPAAIDTEFKAGDDMLYAQYLRDNGDDVQGAIVVRRDLVTGDVDSDQGTVALKYHGFRGDAEYDLLVAEGHGDTVFGIGGIRSIGGAIVRGDVVVTDTTDQTRVQLVANLSYSWVWGGRNVSGAVEYYFNGFGQHEGQYGLPSLAGNADLLARLARGELFTLGRNYFAGSLLVEMSPLWTLTPTLLANVDDTSALLQFVTQYSLSDDMTFLGSVNLPLGSNGTEFGGIDAGVQDTYLSTGASLFAQLAWYF
jgi:hypothetical protein